MFGPKTYHNEIRNIRAFQKKFEGMDDAGIRKESLSLKYEVSSGRDMAKILPTAFALVCEAARRTINMTHFDVQLIGGFHLALGGIAEMQTGEGKTLTATLPVYVNALTGKGCHVATVNDYLAKRDSELMTPVYKALGLTVGVIQTEMDHPTRKLNYQKDITYGTAKEFGFDFLRDRIAIQSRKSNGLSTEEAGVQRPLAFALVDEADSILIDEARTPLKISMPSPNQSLINDCYEWAASNQEKFVQGTHYKYDEKKRKVELLDKGRIKIHSLPHTAGTRSVTVNELVEYMQNAIKVSRDFHLDQHYAIDAEKGLMLIDEFTGRPAEGRQWTHGIHQAVQAKEQIEITPESATAASITIQSYFLKYQQVAGMTGTAWNSRGEFKKVYRKKVVRIPTNKPCIRTQYPTRVFSDWESKWNGIVEETIEMLDKGRSVLIGTRSIERSEILAKLLTEKRINHKVLNARHLEFEAEIVSKAGQKGRVTVATNMAGRGTDILLDDEVRSNGGLHVILTEIHESARIDRQFIGRCARQGDPGSFRVFVGLEDHIIQIGHSFGYCESMKKRFPQSKEISASHFNIFRSAQSNLERRHLGDRSILLRQYKERSERLRDMGQDPYLEISN